ncbi:MAG: histidine kinase [Burkholderiaceae bacterium]
MDHALSSRVLSPARSMLVRAAINQAGCTLIALVLWSLSSHVGLAMMLGYSLIIGNCCWLLIDGSRALVGRWRWHRAADRDSCNKEWPGLLWMAPLVLVGTVLGYVIGSAIADAIFANRSASLADSLPTLLVSVIGASIIVSVFYARERVHATQLASVDAERHASETQLKLLQSQLEPHMLFNTLANLRALIGVDPPRAQAMLDQLIGFLRTTLAATRLEQHALRTEFDCARDYLALMAVRMGPRLQVRFELPGELAALPVPPMLLQPLVENAVKHGLEPQVAGGRIVVSAERDGDRLLLAVRDDGVGVDDAPAAASTGSGSRFGIEQVCVSVSRHCTAHAARSTCAAPPAAAPRRC